MSKNLIIVESPAKVRTIKKFLGKEFNVEASVGHVRDLPVKTLGVDEKSFEPEYRVIPGKEKVVKKLKDAAAKADMVFLAPDPDREGEAIAWHVAELLDGREDDKIRRIQFNEITARAVREALKHPRGLDRDLFNSQQARRVLDRLVGYKVSPILWKKIKRGISAGRVQSVALRIIVEREKERLAFDPKEYWVFKAGLEGKNPPQFETELWKVKGKKADVGSAEQAKALYDKVKDAEWKVAEIAEKERSRGPLPPFITSTLQQEASRRLGFSAKKTMSTAQRLYEGVDLGESGTTALITYMRTDSVRIADEARKAAKEYITETFGKDYYPPKPRYFKSKASAQEAHEAVRPVDPSLAPASLKGGLPKDQLRLYTLIWERFTASQMAAARFHDTTVTVSAADTLWRAKGERVLFDGFMKIYKTGGADRNAELPKLEQGDVLKLAKLEKEQKFTQPPPRYSEASLVKELEDKGVGRPSTYAQIISTLIDREYCRLEEKKFAPTDLGAVVSDLLSEHFPTLMDIKFTANMEESLDKVAEGDVDWVSLLETFTKDFYPKLKKAEEDMARVKKGLETNLKCEKCGRPMVVKFGKAGEFLACSGYPDCKNTKDFKRNQEGEIEILDREPQKPELIGRTCPECGADLAAKRSRQGSRFIGCTAYPDCTYTEPFATGVSCPADVCGGELVEKSSRRGKIFYSCNNYPKCKFALWNPPAQGPCPECGFPVLERKRTKAKGPHLACADKKCKWVLEDGEQGES
jgi:DNA topoisomerase-1